MKKNQSHVKKIVIDPNMQICTDFASHVQNANENEQDICNILIENTDLQKYDFSKLYFENVVFRRCTLTDCTLQKTFFKNVLFEDCSLANCDFTHSWFEQCEMRGCGCKGANFSDTRLTHVSIQDSNFRYANFTSAKLHRCEIMSSDMSDTFFAQCTFELLKVSHSQFTRAEFFHTALKGIDFTTCKLEGICISSEGKELAGVVVDLYQAADLSKILGVVIKEEL